MTKFGVGSSLGVSSVKPGLYVQTDSGEDSDLARSVPASELATFVPHPQYGRFLALHMHANMHSSELIITTASAITNRWSGSTEKKRPYLQFSAKIY